MTLCYRGRRQDPADVARHGRMDGWVGRNVNRWSGSWWAEGDESEGRGEIGRDGTGRDGMGWDG